MAGMTLGEQGSYDDDRWPFGAEMRRRMEQQGLSQNAVADIAGLNRSSVKNLLNGRLSNGTPYWSGKRARGPLARNVLAVARAVDPNKARSDDWWLHLAGIDPSRYVNIDTTPSGAEGASTALVRRIAAVAALLTPRQQRAYLALGEAILNPEFSDYGDTELRTRKVVEERKAPPLRRVEPSEDAD